MSIVWIPRHLAMFGLPATDTCGKMAPTHRDGSIAEWHVADERFWVRKNGGRGMDKSYLLVRPGQPGEMPYGGYAKAALGVICSRVVRAKNKGSRTVELGTVAEFLAEVGIEHSSGGERGTITNVKECLRRMLSCQFVYMATDTKGRDMSSEAEERYCARQRFIAAWVAAAVAGSESPLPGTDVEAVVYRIASSWNLWEDGKTASIEITDECWSLWQDAPVPCDAKAVRTLKSNSLALDIYTWLQHITLFSKYETRASIKVPTLAEQIGCTGGEADLARAIKGREKRILAPLTAEQQARIGTVVEYMDETGAMKKRRVTVKSLSHEREVVAVQRREGIIAAVADVWPDAVLELQDGFWIGPDACQAARLTVRISAPQVISVRRHGAGADDEAMADIPAGFMKRLVAANTVAAWEDRQQKLMDIPF